MEKVFNEEIKRNLKIDKERIAKKVHLDMDDNETYSELMNMIDEAERVASPKAAITKLDVRILDNNQVYLNDILFNSKILATNLTDIKYAYAAVTTCGEEIENWSKKYKNDPLLSYYADAIMLEVLGIAVYAVNNYFSGISDKSLSHISPGSSKDLTIDNQEKLFAVINNVKEKTGVILTPEFLMKPLKSVSGIYYASEEEYTDCSICTRVNCPSRRKPYDDDMYAKMYS